MSCSSPTHLQPHILADDVFARQLFMAMFMAGGTSAFAFALMSRVFRPILSLQLSPLACLLARQNPPTSL